jgi:homoserine O-acetyltransferase
MTDHNATTSVGIVTPQIAQFDEPLALSNGGELPQYQLVYETYGTLNADKSNAVLICHALSGHHHAAGYHSESDKRPGWWDHYIGPNKPIDTNKFYVIALNNLGGCHGSTGPNTINPATGKLWGSDFPVLRVRDWVNSQAKLLDYLGVEKLAAVVGGSLGGMQAMRWTLEYPDRVGACVVVASAMQLSSQNIAFNNIARSAISRDPEWHDGHFYSVDSKPRTGLSLARKIAHVTYLSDDVMGERFGRELKRGDFTLGTRSDYEFQVESYLDHQGATFAEAFDANTYMLMTRALDYFDLAREYGDDPAKAFSHAKCPFLVISFTTDWRFSPERSREIVQALLAAGRPVTYADIESSFGHDAFLLPNPRYEGLFRSFMNNVASGLRGDA